MVSDLARVGQVASGVAALLCVAAIPIAVSVFPGDVGRFALGCVLFGTGMRMYRQYLFVTFKAVQRFDSLAGFQVLEAAVSLAALPIVAIWGLTGLGARFVAVNALVCLVAHAMRPIRPLGGFSWRGLKDIMAIGVRLFASSYLSNVARTLPRIVLLSAGGVGWVGLFAPASAMVRGFSILPASLAIYFYPRMSHQLGATGDPRLVWATVRRVTLVNLAVAVPGVAAAFLCVPTVIKHFFPAYAASIPAVLIVVFSGFFVSSGIAANALHALKSWRWIAVSGAVRLALFGGLPYLGYSVLGSLEGIALGVSGAFAGEFFVTLVAVWMASRQKSAGE